MADQNIIDYLAKLQISAEAAKIYLCLFTKPALSAQAIARLTKIAKTTVYRRLEELKSNSLVEERIEENTRLFQVASAHLLELLVAKKEQETADLRAQLPAITQLLRGQEESLDPETKVLFYRGQAGIQQMVWNVLHAQGEIVGYTYLDLTPFIGRKFYDAWHAEFGRRRLAGRDVYSDEYIMSKFSIDPASISGEGWSSKYIAPDVLNIQHQMDVYDDVVSIYNWVSDDVFGVEIYNGKVAALQRQLFELVWTKGEVYSFNDQQARYRAVKRNGAD
jgi:Fe2+ or Zn2+ uptake regulation protein